MTTRAGMPFAAKIDRISVELLPQGNVLVVTANIAATTIAAANEAMGLEAEGTLEEQADRLLDEIERVRHLTQFGPEA